jgi:hypothetical protein
MKMDFINCIARKTYGYYKKMLIYASLIAAMFLTAWVTFMIIINVVPVILSALSPVPWWAYIGVSIIIVPCLVATLVCYVKYNNTKIEKLDEQYICNE